jgi:hypothetical protein
MRKLGAACEAGWSPKRRTAILQRQGSRQGERPAGTAKLDGGCRTAPRMIVRASGSREHHPLVRDHPPSSKNSTVGKREHVLEGTRIAFARGDPVLFCSNHTRINERLRFLVLSSSQYPGGAVWGVDGVGAQVIQRCGVIFGRRVMGGTHIQPGHRCRPVLESRFIPDSRRLDILRRQDQAREQATSMAPSVGRPVAFHMRPPLRLRVQPVPCRLD